VKEISFTEKMSDIKVHVRVPATLFCQANGEEASAQGKRAALSSVLRRLGGPIIFDRERILNIDVKTLPLPEKVRRRNFNFGYNLLARTRTSSLKTEKERIIRWKKGVSGKRGFHCGVGGLEQRKRFQTRAYSK